MGANEISNRMEATAWITAAGLSSQDGVTSSQVQASDFSFRSLSGFVNKIELLGVDIGEEWVAVTEISIALFLDRNYARKDTTLFAQPIESSRPDLDDPANVLPLIYNGPLRVLPLSAAGYAAIKNQGATPFELPGALDPYSVLLITADLAAFNEFGFGLEFGIEVVRMQDNDAPGTTKVEFINPP